MPKRSKTPKTNSNPGEQSHGLVPVQAPSVPPRVPVQAPSVPPRVPVQAPSVPPSVNSKKKHVKIPVPQWNSPQVQAPPVNTSKTPARKSKKAVQNSVHGLVPEYGNSLSTLSTGTKPTSRRKKQTNTPARPYEPMSGPMTMNTYMHVHAPVLTPNSSEQPKTSSKSKKKAPQVSAPVKSPAVESVETHVIPVLHNAGHNHQFIAVKVPTLGLYWEFTEYPSSDKSAHQTIVIMLDSTGVNIPELATSTASALGHSAYLTSSDHNCVSGDVRQCHVRTFASAHASTGVNYVLVDTVADIRDTWRYVRFAADSGFNIIFWEISSLSGKKTSKIPLTWGAYFAMFTDSKLKFYGTSIDIQVPDKIRAMIPKSKVDGHVTLAFGSLSTELYTPAWLDGIPVTFLRIYEHVDPNGKDAIACVSVKLPDAFMAECGHACKPYLHVTLYNQGKFKAKDSADLVAGIIKATKVTDLKGVSGKGELSYY